MDLEPAPRSDRPGQQLVLRGQRRADSGARVRWRLSQALRAGATASPSSTRTADLIDGALPRVDVTSSGA
jgi:hypothetical protein